MIGKINILMMDLLMEKKEQVSSDRILMIVDTYESDNRMGGAVLSQFYATNPSTIKDDF